MRIMVQYIFNKLLIFVGVVLLGCYQVSGVTDDFDSSTESEDLDDTATDAQSTDFVDTSIIDTTTDTTTETDTALDTEIDECSLQVDDCDEVLEVCVDIVGGFVCECAVGFIDEGDGCINSKQVLCSDDSPVNATATVENETIEYTESEGWATPTECLWSCIAGWRGIGCDECEIGHVGINCDECELGYLKNDDLCELDKNVVWIPIPGGIFDMGSEDGETNELPVHTVAVPSFEMTKTEVTVAQYADCVTVGSCATPISGGIINWGKVGYEDYPLNNVSWDEAVAFCTWTGGRLPSESEWEYAASNCGQDTLYPWGDEAATCMYAVMIEEKERGCGTGETWEVCSKTSGNTILGLCDMSGNVQEWVQDWYHSSYTGAPADGSAWNDGGPANKVTRGGSYSHSSSDDFRAANRNSLDFTYHQHYVGFRCAR